MYEKEHKYMEKRTDASVGVLYKNHECPSLPEALSSPCSSSPEDEQGRIAPAGSTRRKRGMVASHGRERAGRPAGTDAWLDIICNRHSYHCICSSFVNWHVFLYEYLYVYELVYVDDLSINNAIHFINKAKNKLMHFASWRKKKNKKQKKTNQNMAIGVASSID